MHRLPSSENAKCFHCGLPIPRGCDHIAIIDGEAQSMCCPGCKFVAETIVLGGLSNYYRFRSSHANQAEPIDDFTVYDAASVQAPFITRTSNGHHEIDLLIEGITCAACTWLIEQQVDHLPGVDTVTVNLSKHRAAVLFDPDRVRLSQIMTTIESVGYHARPYQADVAEQIQRAEHRRALARLGVAGFGMMQVMMYAIALYLGALQGMADNDRDLIRWVSLLVATPVVFFSALSFFTASFLALRQGQLIMDLPVSIAIGSAYLASCWATWQGAGEVYFDSVVMFTFFLLLGRFLEMQARHRQNLSGSSLKSLLPHFCHRLNGDPQDVNSITGTVVEEVGLDEVLADDYLLVRAGETVPADGIVLTGQSGINESAFSGEYMPTIKGPGDSITAGTINIESALTIKVTAPAQSSQLDSIIKLLDRAKLDKPGIAVTADRVAGFFVFGILLTTVAVAVFWTINAPDHAFSITLSVLVVSCPCALSLATPAALTAATNQVRQLGILISRGHVLQRLRESTHVIFDKTGTLTEGRLRIAETVSVTGEPPTDLLDLAAALEANSAHPIARAFRHHQASPADATIPTRPVIDARHYPGLGMEGVIDDVTYRLGEPRFAGEHCQTRPVLPQRSPESQWLLMTRNSNELAWFRLDDTLRASAIQCIEALQSMGLVVELITGDSSDAGLDVARALSIARVQRGLSPEEKLTYVRDLQAQGAIVIMVGDGINDVPVLAAADVSIAMSESSDLTKATADCVMTTNRLTLITPLIQLAKRTQRIIVQNLSWAICYNLIALPLAAIGLVPPYLAAIGMSSSSLVVVLNALRLNRQ